MTQAAVDSVERSQWYRPYSFDGAFAAGWEAFKEKYGVLLGAAVVYGAIYFAIVVVAALADAMIVGRDAVIQPVSILLGWLIGTPLALGLTYVGAAAVRRQAVNVGDLFIAFQRYGVVIGIALVTTLIGIGIGLLMLVPIVLVSGGGVALLIGIPLLIALLVAAIYISVRLWFSGVLAIDPLGPRLGVIDSIKLSWDITRGRALSLFGLGIVLGLILLGTFVLLALPMIFFGAPLALAVGGAAYALIAAETGVTSLPGVCINCGYPRPDGEICPECGYAAPA